MLFYAQKHNKLKAGDFMAPTSSECGPWCRWVNKTGKDNFDMKEEEVENNRRSELNSREIIAGSLPSRDSFCCGNKKKGTLMMRKSIFKKKKEIRG